MTFRLAITATIMAGLAHAALAEASPAQRQLPNVRAPIEKQEKVEVQNPETTLRRPVAPRSTIATRGQTAQTTISTPQSGIQIIGKTDPTSRWNFVRFLVPNARKYPASQLIVERFGRCGWTTSSFDGSDAPEVEGHENCRAQFERYSSMVARLADRPPTEEGYYELRILKKAWGQLANSGWFTLPVLAVVEGPGSRVTRYRLEYKPTPASPEQPTARIDGDSDGHEPISAGGLDCDDNDASRFPGNIETPDEKDQDCDPYTIGMLDRDGDGYIDWNVSNPAFGSRRTPLRGLDCNDRNPAVRPTSPEIPGDGIDNNCDGDIDFVSD